ncbi:MAG TPA: L-dopachrome tautomerase-related protein [Candidatus Binatia bacterium]|nr:L-dopachrome tautomerase-related protein [Candidatus Binatia bacterium]
MRWIARILAVVVLIAVALAAGLRLTLGGGRYLEDRTTAPELPAAALEKVADLDSPPGNIAVSRTGRVFFTFHPDGHPPFAVAELVGGKPVPFPSAEAQASFRSPLAVRIDARDRLWVLDHADYAMGQPRLRAFDLATAAQVHGYGFPSAVAPLFSMLNDFQIDPGGATIYIADASPIVQRPALLTYDVVAGTSRRLLDGHASVRPRDFILHTAVRDMTLFGLVTLRIGVDTIALDRGGEWLYYGPVNGDRLYRVATRDLNDRTLAPEALAARVEDYGPKPLSDGATTDDAGNVYLTDPEHSALLVLGPDRRLRTLMKDPRLRWPDGLSFGPDGWLYVTCSALQYVLFTTAAERRAAAPYQIWRLEPGATAAPGQ